MESRVRTLIVELNSLNMGEVSALVQKLERTRDELQSLGQEELAAKVEEARARLSAADLPAFRKMLQQVLSKLGHVRA